LKADALNPAVELSLRKRDAHAVSGRDTSSVPHEDSPRITADCIPARENGERTQRVQPAGREFKARPLPVQAGAQVGIQELAAS
jgi:hypothetical protein